MGHALTTEQAAARTLFYQLDEHDHEAGGNTLLGFWIYLMSDCLIFAVLFATYGVLSGNYAGGPGPKELFDLPLVAVNTSMLLLSSITYGFAMLSSYRKNVAGTQLWLAITGLFGAAFLGIELYEFAHMIHEGAGPQRSAFLSSFFTLVGTHGLHVTFGIVWLVTLMVQIGKHGLNQANARRLACLSLFWHFLDVIWIGVFTFVYLMGMLEIAPLHDHVEIFAVGLSDLRPLFSSRRSDRRRMDAPFDPLDQIALPREAMQLPDAEADQHCKASQRGNDDCR